MVRLPFAQASKSDLWLHVAGVERVEVVDTAGAALVLGREAQDRAGQGVAPSRGNSAAVWRFAIIAGAMTTVVSA